MKQLDNSKIQVPSWIMKLGRHRTENGFFEVYNLIKVEFRTAWECYHWIEEQHWAYFKENRYKNFDTFWKAYRRALSKNGHFLKTTKIYKNGITKRKDK